eukprot:2739969-Rhodomonas_salina.1
MGTSSKPCRPHPSHFGQLRYLPTRMPCHVHYQPTRMPCDQPTRPPSAYTRAIQCLVLTGSTVLPVLCGHAMVLGALSATQVCPPISTEAQHRRPRSTDAMLWSTRSTLAPRVLTRCYGLRVAPERAGTETWYGTTRLWGRSFSRASLSPPTSGT